MKKITVIKTLAAALPVSAVLTAPAHAALDSAGALAAITEGGAFIAAIGVAALVVLIAMKMVKRAGSAV